jgi:hypothetical protein
MVRGFIFGFALILLTGGTIFWGWRLRLFLNHDLVPLGSLVCVFGV